MNELKKQILRGAMMENSAIIFEEKGATQERQEILDRINSEDFPSELKAGLMNGTLMLVDHAIYGTAIAGEVLGQASFKTIKGSNMTVDDAYNNVENGKANKEFLLQEVMLEYWDAASNVFASTAPAVGLFLGKFELKVENKPLFDLPMSIFLKPNESIIESAKSKALLYRLKNPKFIRKDSKIELEIKLKAALAAPTTGHYVRTTLIGQAIETTGAISK